LRQDAATGRGEPRPYKAFAAKWRGPMLEVTAMAAAMAVALR